MRSSALTRSRAVATLVVVLASVSAFAALSEEVPKDWIQEATDNIRRMEYGFTASADGSRTAPNRAQDLRTRIGGDGTVEVSPRLAADTFRVALRLSSWGRTGGMSPVDAPALDSTDAEATLDRGVLRERYVNDERGLEQLIDVLAPPAGARAAGPLVLRMEFGGSLRATLQGADVLLSQPGGRPALRLAGLRVTDANHHDVASRFRLAPGEISIEVDDDTAVYPLLVDPLLATYGWQGESNQGSAFYGDSVSTAGDLNGDGLSDILVAAPNYDGGSADEGRVFVYLSNPVSGLPTTATRTFESDQADARFGWSIATAGDLNADGFDDFIVGAQLWNGGSTDEGAVFVYTGAATGPGIAFATRLEINQTDARLGYSVAYAGDVDGDGDSDIVAGAPNWTGGQSHEGALFVFLGDPTTVITGGAPFRGESDQIDAALGIAVAGGVDVDADGFDDVFGSASGWDTAAVPVGRIFGYYGSASGLSTTPSWQEDGFGGNFGGALAAVGDTNGDGYADIVVGANAFTGTLNTEGRIYLYRGSSTGLGSAASQIRSGGAVGANLGGAVAPAGDVNGDGFADVAAGAAGADPGSFNNAGEARVWYGSSSGIPQTASWIYEGTQDNGGAGTSVFTAGDVNGDGFSDLIVGAPGNDSPTADEGEAYVFYGSGDGPVTAEWRTLQADNTANAENFGYSVASAGDVNADGISDIIVGDPSYSGADSGAAFIFLGTVSGPAATPSTTIVGEQFHAFFGGSVAGMSDVNGDGYDDVIVGAPSFDINDGDRGGKIYVYHGGPSGVDATADFTLASTILDTSIGETVAGLGDVNGDGFGDIAYSGQSGDGTHVLYGSSTGIHDGTVTTLSYQEVEYAGDINGDGFNDVITNAGGGVGRVTFGKSPTLSGATTWTRQGPNYGAVHGAGDVNGDGRADVVTMQGSFSATTNELHLGYADGLHDTPDQTLGFRVDVSRWAGDVNGDGFADLILRTLNDVVEIHFGSPAGYSDTPDWTVSPAAPGQHFAFSFGTAGDVNGDTFSDVIIGAYDGPTGGNAKVWLGGGGDGLDFSPRNVRGDNTGPTAFHGNSGSSDRFRISTRGRSARGRALIALDHQVAPLSTSIESGTFSHGNYFDTGATDSAGADVNFGRLVSGLTLETKYKWRIRFVTPDPIFPGSRWMSLPGNGPNQWDVATSCLFLDWYVDNDNDGFGSAITQSSCSEPPGQWTTSPGDCNDADATMFPGNPEVCDGKDNNCVGGIDDGFSAPTGQPAIGTSKSGSSITLIWSAIPFADRYDVVRGGLNRLRQTSGDYSVSISACVGNDQIPVSSTDPATATGADGYWYLVRPVNCTAAGTYDGIAGKQQGFRDAEIAASGNACP